MQIVTIALPVTVPTFSDFYVYAISTEEIDIEKVNKNYFANRGVDLNISKFDNHILTFVKFKSTTSSR